MTTTATLIADTTRHLLAGDRDETNALNADIDANATTWAFTRDLAGIQPGSYVGCDLELVYVWSVNSSNRTAVVQRGMLGSIQAAHTATTMVSVNPKFSGWDIFNALNVEIRDMSTPPNGLFQMKSLELTTQPIKRTYPISDTNIIDIYDIRYLEPGAEFAWLRLPHYEWTKLLNMPTAYFPSGFGLRLDRMVYPGRTMNVLYMTRFSELSSLTDDVVSVTGIPPTAVDIPPLGAAARLMGVREAKRSFAESEVDTRRASEVPPGAAARAAQTLLALLNERIRSELAALLRQYPDAK